MHRSISLRLLLSLCLLAPILILARAAFAGPPLICHPIDIGDATSLSWGDSAFTRTRGYKSQAVVRDTLALLDDSTPILVRMETMRRAALYLEDETASREKLRVALLTRVLDAEAAGTPSALAWFDAGYFTQTVSQLSARDPHVTSATTADQIKGYRWVARAIELQPDDAALEFAGAMMTALANVPEHAKHVRRARELAGSNTLLKKNIAHHVGQVWPSFQGS